ncbi:MAG TPA: beta-N-acetylhexosaminidase [Rikenellaceae bacterium]|nr:beta-N-acetylhexosaminidase [Rikenellaceae bacterium]
MIKNYLHKSLSVHFSPNIINMKNFLPIILTLAMSSTTLSVSGSAPAPGGKHLKHSIIPEPQVVVPLDGAKFKIDSKSVIVAIGCEEMNSATFLKSYLQRYYGVDVVVVDKLPARESDRKAISSVIQLNLRQLAGIDPMPNFGYDLADLKREGAYHLQVGASQATLTGANPSGLFYAIQTLIQLLPVPADQNITAITPNSATASSAKTSISGNSLYLPQILVVDFPRFEYRGMHLDVVRHIYSVDYVKQYIDYLALHKMNYFHWHLTDDQGWRMESKSHPLLNEIGSWRAGTIIGIFPGTGVDSTRYGGFYTIAQMKEIVEYAAQRYITVVPEIDVPGHSMAIIATYPHFSTTPEIPKQPAITWGIYNRQNNVLAPSEEVFKFLEDVFNELMDVFPGKYIHIGADECAKKWWEESAKTQEFMLKYGLKDENELQKYFAKRIADIVHARGREFIGWDEMLDDGLVKGAVVMSWRNVENGIKAAELGHKAIMTPIKYSYFNVAQKRDEDTLCHRAWFAPVDSVYLFEPVPADVPASVAANIIGGQGCMWTEYFPHKQRLEYGIFPRFSALAEVYWTLPANKNWPKFQLKLVDQFDRYDLWGANYSTEIFRSAGFDRNRY